MTSVTNTNRAVSDLIYSIGRLPSETFRSIHLYFSSSNSVGMDPLCGLMEVILLSRCSDIRVDGCSTSGRRQILLDGFTPSPVELLNIHADLTPDLFQPLIIGAFPFLVDLTLQTGTTSTKWKDFLRAAYLPRLKKIKLSEDIPLLILISFLNRHIEISQVSIATSQSAAGNVLLVARKKLVMPNIKVLSAPSRWMLAILESAATPPTLSRLCVLAQRPPYQSTLSTILSCLKLCEAVEEVEISLPASTPHAILRPNDKLNYEHFPSLKTNVFKILFTEFATALGPALEDADIMVSALILKPRL
jgi:hypothetical protein